eukprot:6176200-Pleurochrysis_carterae.AAC.1
MIASARQKAGLVPMFYFQTYYSSQSSPLLAFRHCIPCPSQTKHRENMRALEKELASSEKKLKDSQERKAADASALAALEAQRNGVEDRIFA